MDLEGKAFGNCIVCKANALEQICYFAILAGYSFICLLLVS